MSDDITKFEVHRQQLVSGLKCVAETMRSTADIAEAFASRVQNSNFNPGNFITQDSGTKRKRKPKDPNAPKRPASSYLLFQNEIRKDIKEKNPGMSHHDLMGVIGKMWQDMSDTDKAIYNNAAASAKEQYSQKKQAYAARSPEEVAAANALAATETKPKPRKRVPKTPAIVEEAVALPPVAVQVSPSSEASDTSDADSSEDEPPKDDKRKSSKEESDEDSADDDDDDDDEASPPPPPPKKAKTKPEPAPAPAVAPKKRRGPK